MLGHISLIMSGLMWTLEGYLPLGFSTRRWRKLKKNNLAKRKKHRSLRLYYVIIEEHDVSVQGMTR